MSITLRVQGSPQSLSNEPSRAACWHEHSPREAFPQAMDLVLVLEHLNQMVSQQNPDCSTDPQRKLKEDLGNIANSPRQVTLTRVIASMRYPQHIPFVCSVPCYILTIPRTPLCHSSRMVVLVYGR